MKLKINTNSLRLLILAPMIIGPGGPKNTRLPGDIIEVGEIGDSQYNDQLRKSFADRIVHADRAVYTYTLDPQELEEKVKELKAEHAAHEASIKETEDRVCRPQPVGRAQIQQFMAALAAAAK